MKFIVEMWEKVKVKFIDHFAGIIVVGGVVFLGQIIPDQLHGYLKNKFFGLLTLPFSVAYTLQVKDLITRLSENQCKP